MEIGKPLLGLEFQLNLDDFLETVRARESRSTRVSRVVFMAVGFVLLALLLGGPFLMKEVPGFLVAFLFGVLPLAVLMVILPWYYSPVRFYKSYFRTHVFKPCRIEIGEEGIKFSTDTSESMLLWNAFNDCEESKSQLVLTSGMVQYIFPRRAIEHGKFAELVELVKKKRPRCLAFRS